MMILILNNFQRILMILVIMANTMTVHPENNVGKCSK